jgi:hypothetical protein
LFGLFLGLALEAGLGACVGDDPTPSDTTGVDGAVPDAPATTLDGATSDATSPGSDGGDGAVVATKPCDPTSAFTVVTLATELDSTNPDTQDLGARLTSDQLGVYWVSDRDGTAKVYSGKRNAVTDPFGSFGALSLSLPVAGTPNGVATYDDPNVLFVGNTEHGALAHAIVSRFTKDGGAWGQAEAVPGGDLGGSTLATHPFVTTDGKNLLFDAIEPSGSRQVIYEAKTSIPGVFGDAPAVRDELTSASGRDSTHPVMSKDKLAIYFASNRGKASADIGDFDIFVAMRATETAAFDGALPLQGVSISSAADMPSWISPDQCTLYFFSDRAATSQTQIYKATRQPPN